MLKQNVVPTLRPERENARSTFAVPNLDSAARHPNSAYGRILGIPTMRLVLPTTVDAVA